MSYRKDRLYQQQKLEEQRNEDTKKSAYDFSFPTAQEDLIAQFHDILKKGVHGFCFSMYEDGQKPGDIMTKTQVMRRMQILKPHCKWVRSFSCTEGNEYVPIVAKEMGIKTLVGAWLSNDLTKNEEEIEALINLANKGLVDIAAVGNEVLYRKELDEDTLIAYIERVRKAIPSAIPVGYVDAYYEFSIKPKVTAACDVILSNCYPYWEGCPLEYSLEHMNSMYHQAMAAGQGKKVIITETGWPWHGETLHGSVPTRENAMKYFIDSHIWANQNSVETFYFSSFDESWKKGPEGEVGAHWGVWDKYERLKETQ